MMICKKYLEENAFEMEDYYFAAAKQKC